MSVSTIHELKFRVSENQENKQYGEPSSIHISVRAVLDAGVTAPVGSVRILRFWSDMMPYSENESKAECNAFLPQDYSLYAALDGYDGDTALVFEELASDEESDDKADFYCALINSDLFYIDRITVNEYWRGNGIGTQILKAIPGLLSKKTKTEYPAIILIASPYEMEKEDAEFNSMKDRLRAWYTRNGYVDLFPNADTMVYF